ncbi:MAG: hypothetical protein IKJ99_07575 [Oscillospiraceae bacterium]|nr:hypothetical protein [Oscillospiraceae bacterium]
MVGTYEICQGDRLWGEVNVTKEGLYYCISCRCQLSGDVMHHLVVRCGGRETSLGTCVPMEGGFGVEKRISCKSLGQGTPEFLLLPKHENMQGKFVPIYPEEPFSYMEKLKDAFLARQGDQQGIMIKE